MQLHLGHFTRLLPAIELEILVKIPLQSTLSFFTLVKMRTTTNEDLPTKRVSWQHAECVHRVEYVYGAKQQTFERTKELIRLIVSHQEGTADKADQLLNHAISFSLSLSLSTSNYTSLCFPPTSISSSFPFLLPSVPTGVTIGLEMTLYTVEESDGNVKVCVVLVSGALARRATVHIFTQDNTATGTCNIHIQKYKHHKTDFLSLQIFPSPLPCHLTLS